MTDCDLYGISDTLRRHDSAVNKKYVVDNFLGTDDFRKKLSETLFEEYRAKNNHIMHNVERGVSNLQAVYDGSARKKAKLVDQRLDQADVNQSRHSVGRWTKKQLDRCVLEDYIPTLCHDFARVVYTMSKKVLIKGKNISCYNFYIRRLAFRRSIQTIRLLVT